MPRKLGPFGKGKRWGGQPSRLQQLAQNTLGIISTDQMLKNQKFRDLNLERLDAYYEGRQYDGLTPWDDAVEHEEYIPVRKRKPRVMYALPRVLVNKVASKLAGSSVFPKFKIEDDLDDTEFFRTVVKAADLRRNMMQPFKHALISGSVFVRFYLVEGNLYMEHYNSKFCYPVFDAAGELDSVEVKYVYEDPNDKDMQGNPKQKWYRLSLTKTVDTLYDNPEYREGVNDPQFQVVGQNAHNLGWVQGEWFRTEKHKFSPDGPGLFSDILDFVDELNYSLSQTSQAVGYNQEPQLVINGVDEDELENLIRSSTKAWNLGREGKASFVGSDLKGVDTAEQTRDHMRSLVLDVVRVVLHDPEKMTAQAQSGRALEVLNAPLVELVDELRTAFEPSLRNLVIKMAMTLLKMIDGGMETVLQIPEGYQPQSLDLTIQWPPIFPLTLDDIVKKVQAANTASTAQLISRESLTQWLASDFGIEDVDAELQKISSQPQINPFGSFGGGFGGGE